MEDRLEAAWKNLGLTANVISLKSRPDRANNVAKTADKLRLPFELYQVDRHPTSGAQGCFESHVELFNRAQKLGQKKLFVLEDDFEPSAELFTEKGMQALEEAIEFSKGDDWDLIYFGVLPNIWTSESTREGQHMYKLVPWASTHAYIINEEYMKIASQWTFKENGKDAIDWRFRSCRRAYTIHPQAFNQNNSPSDIEHFQTPAPTWFRHIPASAASWYALNVGFSVSQILLVLFVVFLISWMTSSKNRDFANRVLLRGE